MGEKVFVSVDRLQGAYDKLEGRDRATLRVACVILGGACGHDVQRELEDLFGITAADEHEQALRAVEAAKASAAEAEELAAEARLGMPGVEIPGQLTGCWVDPEADLLSLAGGLPAHDGGLLLSPDGTEGLVLARESRGRQRWVVLPPRMALDFVPVRRLQAGFPARFAAQLPGRVAVYDLSAVCRTTLTRADVVSRFGEAAGLRCLEGDRLVGLSVALGQATVLQGADGAEAYVGAPAEKVS